MRPSSSSSRPHGRRDGRRRDVAAGARDAAVICPGMALLGVTFGLLVVHAGLAWWWTPLFSGLIFGGSLEFLLIVMVTTATPLAAIALTSLWSWAGTRSTPCPSPYRHPGAGCAASTPCTRSSTRPTP